MKISIKKNGQNILGEEEISLEKKYILFYFGWCGFFFTGQKRFI